MQMQATLSDLSKIAPVTIGDERRVNMHATKMNLGGSQVKSYDRNSDDRKGCRDVMLESKKNPNGIGWDG